MKAILVTLFACMAVASAQGPLKVFPDGRAGYLVAWYDCRGKADGRYRAETADECGSLCNQYIECVDSLYAYRVECPKDNNGNDLHFSKQDKECVAPTDAKCDPHYGGDCAEPGPGLPPPSTCASCKLNGYCTSYTWEKPNVDYSTPNCTGFTEVQGTCDEGLWWNPYKPGTEEPHEHGGHCDEWGNLAESVRKEYKHDPMCIPHCYFENVPKGEACTKDYIYFDEVDGKWTSHELSCPDGLCWDNDVRTCVVAGN